MAAHSSILAWKIPWTQSLVGYRPWGRKESDTTEHAQTHTHTHTHTHTSTHTPVATGLLSSLRYDYLSSFLTRTNGEGS